jgi:signal transduction histidine kinase
MKTKFTSALDTTEERLQTVVATAPPTPKLIADTNTPASVLSAQGLTGRDRAGGGENVTEPAKSKNDVPLETSIPGASLESILCTEELQRRPSRPPDYGNENRALVALASALADSPRTILQTLAEKVLEVLQADSSGLSLLTKDEKRFYWAAIAGAWHRHIGGGTPRGFGPCGDVLDRGVPMLFTHWERRYAYLRPATPLAEEGLLVPFYVNGKAVGTIWAIAHNDRRKFDAEDLRLLESLGRFASAAYQTVASIDDLKFQIAAREKAETELRQLTDGLEGQVRVRTQELEKRNAQLAEAKALLAEEKLALECSETYARGQVEALVQSLDALATAPAPDQFFLRMLSTMGRLLGSQWIAVWLWLVDDATDSLVLRSAVRQDNFDLDASEHPFVKDPLFWKEDGGLQELFFTGVPIPYEDVETDPRIPNALREYFRSQGTRKILRLPMLVGGKVKGLITICHAKRPPYQAAEIELAQALAHQAMLAIQSGRAATLEERNRMARDIHDTLAQGFTGIVVQLQAAEDASARGLKKDAQKHLRSARDLARQSLVEARRSVHALRAQALKDTSFWDALKGMIKQTTAGTALHTMFRMRGHPRELPPLWQQNLLHIGQEALTNTLKYARASRFEARLSFNKKELRLELEDNGEGFTTTDCHDGFGLIGMRERVEQMGGTLTITSARNEGTQVVVVSPYLA